MHRGLAPKPLATLLPIPYLHVVFTIYEARMNTTRLGMYVAVLCV
jgi:hypothetical protein